MATTVQGMPRVSKRASPLLHLPSNPKMPLVPASGVKKTRLAAASPNPAGAPPPPLRKMTRKMRTGIAQRLVCIYMTLLPPRQHSCTGRVLRCGASCRNIGCGVTVRPLSTTPPSGCLAGVTIASSGGMCSAWTSRQWNGRIPKPLASSHLPVVRIPPR